MQMQEKKQNKNCNFTAKNAQSKKKIKIYFFIEIKR